MSYYKKVFLYCYGYESMPLDDKGRVMEIHHIDGDSANNHPANLQLVTIYEHYKIHRHQGDSGACYYIMIRMSKTPKEISDEARAWQYERVKLGVHQWLGDGELQRSIQQERVRKGTHPFLRPNFQRDIQLKNVAKGTHNFLGEQSPLKMFENGTHPSLVTRTCPHCGLTGNGGTMIRWHFDNCRKVYNGAETEAV
jgi:hypothetical protein